MKSPFKFLDPFELQDIEAFFGRKEETRELYNLVTKNRLTFVYGPSGSGKTSLVQCGLANRFGGSDWLPLFVRRGEDLNASLRRELAKTLGKKEIEDIPSSIESLFTRYLRPVYLIFDQFEELFILGGPTEQRTFYDTIAELNEAELPCRILFIIREDYFGHLNQFEKTIPDLYHRKLRVEPMGREQLHAVITGSCRVFGIGFDDARRSPDLILNNILADNRPIDMPYVQVYLQMLFEEATRGMEDQPARFTDAAIKNVGKITDALGRFLENQKKAIDRILRGKTPAFALLPEDAVSQVLNEFVSREGTKIPVSYDVASDGSLSLSSKVARALFNLPPAFLSDCVLELERSRILRRSDDAFEVAHDKLAALIDQQRTVEQRQLSDIRQRIEIGVKEHQESAEGKRYYFDPGQLARIEPFLPKLALEPEQLAFLENSRLEAERKEKAEKERTERELRLAEEKLATEEHARKRQTFFTRIVAAVAILAIASGVFAFFKQQQATKAEQSALAKSADLQRSNAKLDSAQQALVAALDTAEIRRLLAEQSDSIARSERDVAERERQKALAALLEVKSKSILVVKGILKDTRKDFYHLRYPEAMQKLRDAAAIGEEKADVAKALLEIAFFYEESGQIDLARSPLDLAARLVGKTAGTSLDDLLAIPILSRWRDTLMYRYYPHMILVQGGDAEIGDGRIPTKVSTFKIAETETTMWQFALYCSAVGLSIGNFHYKSWGDVRGDDPVIYVSWYDAALYANWLSEKFSMNAVYDINENSSDNQRHWRASVITSAKGYRLPSEVEWEFAARGGIRNERFEYAGSDSLELVGWYSKNSDRTNPVKTRQPNNLRLYDMSGNVWEWCEDLYGSYPDTIPPDYRGPDQGDGRVDRGGGWGNYAEGCRVAVRDYNWPGYRSNGIGFRLVLQL